MRNANSLAVSPGVFSPAGTSPSGSEDGGQTYAQIVKSSAVMGSSSVLTLAINVARTKVLALLIGPSGVGAFGLYISIFELASTIAGMGLRNGGVRQIAESAGTGNAAEVARTATVVRELSLILGVFGAALLTLASGAISTLTFGHAEQWEAVALLALAVLFSVVTAGEQAIVQGTRRISALAKMAVWSAALGTAATLGIVYFFRDQGVVPSIIAAAAASCAMARWYSRKIARTRVRMNRPQWQRASASLMQLGFAFLVSGALTMFTAYAVRVIVMREGGLEAAGYYQAAWTLGGLYVGFVLQAMGTDFYPRLVAGAHDDELCNRLVNEQIRVSLLLAGPGVLATLALASFVVHAFYSAAFASAAPLLRWIALGMALRVITWPLGYLLVAKQKRIAFVGVEAAWTIAVLGLTTVFLPLLGVVGAGIAFFASCILHGALVYPISTRVSGFRLMAPNRKVTALYLTLIGAVFVSFHVLSATPAILFGISAALGSAILSTRTLFALAIDGNAPRLVERCFGLARWRANATKDSDHAT